MGDRWQATTLDVINALGRTKFQADCDAIMAIVDARPQGIKLSELYRAHPHLRGISLSHEAFFSLAALNGRIAELLAGVADLCGPRSRAAVHPCDSS
jgi:hypothetical protein